MLWPEPNLLSWPWEDKELLCLCSKKGKQRRMSRNDRFQTSYKKYCVKCFRWKEDLDIFRKHHSRALMSVVAQLSGGTICLPFTFTRLQNTSVVGRTCQSSLLICIHQRENGWTWYSGVLLWFPGSPSLSLFPLVLFLSTLPGRKNSWFEYVPSVANL